jgi:hypothetical protein
MIMVIDERSISYFEGGFDFGEFGVWIGASE